VNNGKPRKEKWTKNTKNSFVNWTKNILGHIVRMGKVVYRLSRRLLALSEESPLVMKNENPRDKNPRNSLY